MPISTSRENNDSTAKHKGNSKQSPSLSRQATPQAASGPEALSDPPQAALGSDFGQATFERYAAMLGDPRMSHPMYAQQRATMVRQVQRDYGNQYVQRLVNHIEAKKGNTVQRVETNMSDSLPSASPPGVRRQEARDEDVAVMNVAIQRQKAIADSPGGLAGQKEMWHPWKAYLPGGTSHSSVAAPSTIGTEAEVVQPKLAVGPAGDKYEREADAVAKQVVSRINGSAQRQDEEELQMMPLDIQRQEKEEEFQTKLVQRQIGLEGGEVDPDVERSIESAKGGGKAFPDDVRIPMESAFGADFSGVRVHTGSESDSLNDSMGARAFTTGQDIFFRNGEFNPRSKAGQETIAHELTHVVQQISNSPVNSQSQRLPPIIQRKGDPNALAEGEWANVSSGGTLKFTALAAGCMAVTTCFSDGGGAGVHMALKMPNAAQWKKFVTAIAGKIITTVYLDGDMVVGQDEGWHVKLNEDSYMPETEMSPRSAAELVEEHGKDFSAKGWANGKPSVEAWFKAALGASEVTISTTSGKVEHQCP